MEHHFLIRHERCSGTTTSSNIGTSNSGAVVLRRGSLPLKKRKLALPGLHHHHEASLAASCASGTPLSSLVAASAAASLPTLPDLTSPLQAAAAAASRASLMSWPQASALYREDRLLSPSTGAAASSGSSASATTFYGGEEHMAALALLSAAATRSTTLGGGSGALAFPPQLPLLPKRESLSLGGLLGRPLSSDEDTLKAPNLTSSLKARMMMTMTRERQVEGLPDAGSKPTSASYYFGEGPADDSSSESLSDASTGSSDDRSRTFASAAASKVPASVPGMALPSRETSSASTTSALPLPGGCHGRCARSGAYCQRPGSYQGSPYCKLHHHRYVGGGGGVDELLEGSATPSSTTTALAAAPWGGNAAAADGKTGGGPLHQDKRCTGAPWERRCQATTTRGRPCAYVAADGKPFCNLHACSFKTQGSSNSSHRRGSSSTTTAAKAASTKSGQLTGVPPLQLVSPVQVSRVVDLSSSLSSSGSLALAEASPRSSKDKSVVSKRRAKHNDSPHPLLSKVPVDQWFGKHVKIACGPMAGKVGTVERWGNGWITVRVDGVGSHNRRSFELYVVDDAAATGENQGVASSSSLLLRSTVSPSPSSDSGSSTLKFPPTSIVHKVSYSYDGDDATPGATSDVDKSQSVLVPETPRNDRPLMEGIMSSSFSGHGGAGDDGAHPIITPVSPKRARTELPLSESLALAQEGNAKKYRIDMLFGTAALERGRRSVHHRSSSGSNSDSSTK